MSTEKMLRFFSNIYKKKSSEKKIILKSSETDAQNIILNSEKINVQQKKYPKIFLTLKHKNLGGLQILN